MSGYYSSNNRSIEALFRYIAFVIDNLRVKILIDIDILTMKDVNLVIFIRTNFINSYNTIF